MRKCVLVVLGSFRIIGLSEREYKMIKLQQSLNTKTYNLIQYLCLKHIFYTQNINKIVADRKRINPKRNMITCFTVKQRQLKTNVAFFYIIIERFYIHLL